MTAHYKVGVALRARARVGVGVRLGFGSEYVKFMASVFVSLPR